MEHRNDLPIDTVNVHSLLTVVSSKATGPGAKLMLNRLDHAMGRYTIHLVFYYRVNPFRNRPLDAGLDNLRVTLSDLLSVYPKITGRLGKKEDGDWEVICNDAGLRAFRASVGISIDEWLRSRRVDDEIDLTVWDDLNDDYSIWSPFRIQFNDFEGGGLAIGFSYTHLHADISSAIIFFKSFAEMYRGESISQLPVFNLPVAQFSPNVISRPDEYNSRNSKVSKTEFQKMSTVTFKFSDTSMKKNLSKFANNCPNATPFDFLLALFWTRISKNSDTNYHQERVSVCIDMRRKVIPKGYFGNAVRFLSLSNESNREMQELVSFVHGEVANLKNDEFFSAVDLLEAYDSPSQTYRPDLTFVSMENVPMYSVNFEMDEKPVHVSCRIGNVEGKGLIIVTPSLEGGLSRNVTVTLPEKDIDSLCVDEVVSDLKPVVVMRGEIL